MKTPESVDSLIRARWAFATGVVIGGAFVQLLGLIPSLTFGAGLLTMGLVATITDPRRAR